MQKYKKIKRETNNYIILAKALTPPPLISLHNKMLAKKEEERSVRRPICAYYIDTLRTMRPEKSCKITFVKGKKSTR